jgi:nuclear GTP-binding protein
LNQVAIKKGKLKKGGEPDVKTTAKLILIDWQRGELPYFTLPPNSKEEKNEEENLENVKEEDFLQEVGGIPQVIDVEEMAEIEQAIEEEEQVHKNL